MTSLEIMGLYSNCVCCACSYFPVITCIQCVWLCIAWLCLLKHSESRQLSLHCPNLHSRSVILNFNTSGGRYCLGVPTHDIVHTLWLCVWHFQIVDACKDEKGKSITWILFSIIIIIIQCVCNCRFHVVHLHARLIATMTQHKVPYT